MYLTPIDFKNHIYCPRQIYYKYILCVEIEETVKMNYGKIIHTRIIELEKRRGLKKYGLENYNKRFNVKLKSEEEKLIGIIDMIIEDIINAYPVDFKTTEPIFDIGYRLQLYCYKKLLEKALNKNSEYGFIYYISSNKLKKIEFTEEDEILYQTVKKEMIDIIEKEKLLDVDDRSKCYECEYINYCNDVI